MNVTFINESDAPAVTVANKVPNKNQTFATDVLAQLVVGKAARLTLDAGDTTKALKRAFTTVGKATGVEVQTWNDPTNDRVLFVKRINAPEAVEVAEVEAPAKGKAKAKS